MKASIPVTHSNDNWAQFELFRWEYGVLPASGDLRKCCLNAKEVVQ
jgi:hypothetical protein